MIRSLLLVATAVGPAILFAVLPIGQLRDPFPVATLLAAPFDASLRVGLAAANTVAVLELCLAVSLVALLGRSRLPARLGIVGLVPLILILSHVAQQPP